MTPLLVVITGPTAVGKTELCVKIAQHFNTEIISADSRQFYKELSIGTAKPTHQEMDGVKHHFVNSLSIQDDYNVSDYEKDVLKLLEELFKKHHLVILTGGSGLFIDAVCDGFDDELPKGSEKIRVDLEKLYEKYGITLLQEKLKQLDPHFYDEIDKDNLKRLYRAIEVCILAGKPYSKIRKGKKQERPFNVLKIALNRDREELYDKINKRVDLMIEDGLVEEVKSVIHFRQKNALKTVGYRELFDYLDKECSLNEAIEKIKVNTRRYAKKQINWFKKDVDYHWFTPNETDKIIELISFNLN